jgi:hypothetical protein
VPDGSEFLPRSGWSTEGMNVSPGSITALTKARYAVIGALTAATMGSGALAVHLAHDQTHVAATGATSGAPRTERPAVTPPPQHKAAGKRARAKHPTAQAPGSGFQPVAPVTPAGSGGSSGGSTGGS